MTHYVFDSSALAKAYLPEAGSALVAARLSLVTAGGAQAIVSALAYPETISAVARRQRNGRITPADAAARIVRINADFTGPQPPFAVIAVGAPLATQAAALVRSHALSGADAVHLATALALRVSLRPQDNLEFLTTDGRLDAAARAEGLSVTVPN